MKGKSILGRLGIADTVTRWYFNHLAAYQDYDKLIEGRMKDAILKHYASLVSYDGREEETREILNYQTGLYQAATVQTLAIWGGNRGFEEALNSDSALDLATTLRLAFGEGDVIDTCDDDYDPRILELKRLDSKTLEERLRMNRVYQNIIRHLDQLISERFKTLHKSGYSSYVSGRKEVESGQAEDIRLRILYLTGEFDEIRDSYSTLEDVTGLLVRKLGLMGHYAARIVYEESGGQRQDVEDALSQFYTCAGVLLQLWTNDVRKLWLDVGNLDTNPIITYSICQFPDICRIDKGLVLKLLKKEPDLLRKMAGPYRQKMKKALNEIRRFGFETRTHQGLAFMIEKYADEAMADWHEPVNLQEESI